MADRATEPFVVSVLIRSEPARLTGQAAEAVALLTAYAERLNAIPVGRAVVSFSQGRVRVEIAESLPSLRIDAPPDESATRA